MTRGPKYTDYLTRKRVWVGNPGNPLLLTHEPAGDDETDIAWVVRGKLRDLGRYVLCPHLNGALKVINHALVVNDGMGMGAEAVLQNLNTAMTETQFSLGACAVKPFIPVFQEIVDLHDAQGHGD